LEFKTLRLSKELRVPTTTTRPCCCSPSAKMLSLFAIAAASEASEASPFAERHLVIYCQSSYWVEVQVAAPRPGFLPRRVDGELALRRWCGMRRRRAAGSAGSIRCAGCNADRTLMSSWSGQPGGPRYCHRKPCQRAGREAGHIVARKRKHSAPTCDSDLADHEDRSILPRLDWICSS